MNDVIAQRDHITPRYRPGTHCFDATRFGSWKLTPENIVLPAAIDSDHRPDRVVVRRYDDSRRPDDVENGQFVGLKQYPDIVRCWFAELVHHGGTIRHGSSDNLANILL